MTWHKVVFDNLMVWVIVATLIFVGVSLLINAGRSCDTTNNFVVLDDANMTNQSLSTLYFDCVKFCSDRFASQGMSSTTNCYQQCDKIGALQ
jgi:hypothetical protein